MFAKGLASLAALGGCECGPKNDAGIEDLSAAKVPANFDQVMADHARLSIVARNALIRGEIPVARQPMRKLAFFMQHGILRHIQTS